MSCVATIYTEMLFGVFPTSFGIVTDIFPSSIPRKEPRSVSKAGLFLPQRALGFVVTATGIPAPPSLGLESGGLLRELEKK